ncbi:hypothetical protein PF005_g28185 [Phytophthora fragariae]|uniref:RxLR effector protein n=1 Tax=Phytophthora fragariae TaxID=53985 RepID=A0A6A3DHT9_9STRA|nr:hypothetical protein PF003_g17442 [Phytophthora fragariae]KAE8920989.1 hypothetical protein PF009_g28724 [Phytophthora fragariae]KAE8968440.1 hypothetical protein PF011_g27183 [Phytophthora fragariae]KAE9066620.1 hypothetical protein PF010_g27787 [Phytophthora fragariae]KAE9067249.1 hypothetical protein PF007_g28146 [Phytophthora fragariae]
MLCFTLCVLHATSTDARPTPPAFLGVYNRPGLTLCLGASAMAWCHKNCFWMLRN